MKKNKLNHNKEFMFGILALAIIVFGVVVFFWMWCFPDKGFTGSSDSNSYRINLETGFRGDSIQIYVDDSLYYNDRVETDSFDVNVETEKQPELLMIVNVKTEIVNSFDVSDMDSVVILKSKDGNTDINIK